MAGEPRCTDLPTTASSISIACSLQALRSLSSLQLENVSVVYSLPGQWAMVRESLASLTSLTSLQLTLIRSDDMAVLIPCLPSLRQLRQLGLDVTEDVREDEDSWGICSEETRERGRLLANHISSLRHLTSLEVRCEYRGKGGISPRHRVGCHVHCTV